MKRIAFLTDIHLDEPDPLGKKVRPKENLALILDDLVKRDTHEIIFGGDIGAASAHPYFFDALKQFQLKLILGNHDNFNEVGNFYKPPENTKELYYQHEDEHFRNLFLDTSRDRISTVQSDWLQRKMETNKKLVLFIHHPVLAIDTPADKLYPLQNRETLKKILLDSRKEVTIFCGHYHMNDEQTYLNLNQYTTPSICFQLVKNADELRVDNSKFGYRIIEIDGEKLTTEIVFLKLY